MLEIVQGPDFPTGGFIHGRSGIKDAYTNGRGRFLMRAKVAIEHFNKERDAIIVTEIPYQVNKARLIERIAELVNEQDHRGDQRHPRRERPRRHAHRHRAEARRRSRRLC